MKKIGAHYQIQGIVQGVGFRPFVYNLANSLGICGWVKNTSSGVEIEVDGFENVIDSFTNKLQTDAPPLAKIDNLKIKFINPNGYSDFQIFQSETIAHAFQPISPDVSICQDCLNEMFSPTDRRYLYPFINCTNCGPRFTIIKDIPYDRPFTTMSGFPMCEACKEEYLDPTNRRFHAQPIACPDCGPKIWLEDATGRTVADGILAIQKFQEKILSGDVVAVKGIGGFHLACDALNDKAIDQLRSRKQRVDKPFALMMPDLLTIEKYCILTNDDRDSLVSRERPIVLLQRRQDTKMPANVAPGQNTLGIMLPYSPLHYLLFSQVDPSSEHSPSQALVLTSGNISEEPIATDNTEALERLSGIADAFLMHNRPIFSRCDDSVVRVIPRVNNNTETITDNQKQIFHLRRSRGFSPFPIKSNWHSPPLLACGPELKNTFCLYKESYAFVSHHIGDLENFETLKSFEDSIEHYQKLFKIKPEYIAYDLHPDYLATRYAKTRAQEEKLQTLGIQHHHAHIASCMAENYIPGDKQVIGVSFDGTGYGSDGAIWGGEFLLSSYQSFKRLAHLKYVPLPGGDHAIREPWRMALSWLHASGIDWQKDLPPVQHLKARNIEPELFTSILRNKTNSPDTSSMGRLFDAVASITGIEQEVNYEAQAAIELESRADPFEVSGYSFDLVSNKKPDNIIIDPTPVLKEIVYDVMNQVSTHTISAKFHQGVSRMVLEICKEIKREHNLNDVVLSGGVWQNMILLNGTRNMLQNEGFKIWTHSRIPTNDGGISLGQAAIAGHFLSQ